MMPFLSNIVLAFIWALFTGSLNIYSLLVGFLVGYGILGLVSRGPDASSYTIKVVQVVRFLIVFLKELLVSSIRVAYDVVTPTYYMRPGIIAIPLDAKTDLEITLLANVISLTPGTLSLDVSADRKTLYIHAMFIDNEDELRRGIKEGLEKRLLEVMR